MQIKELVEKYKNKIINISVIILALFITRSIHLKQTALVTSLNQTRQLEEKKNLILGKISEAEKRFNAHKELINAKDISLVIDTINKMAQNSGVKIMSLKPEEKKDYPLYIKYPFTLSLYFNDYHQLGKFISHLESHKDIYIIESIDITKRFASSREEQGGLSVRLTLSTLLLNE